MAQTFAGKPLCSPALVRWQRDRFRREALPLLDRANSLWCPGGKWPAQGWLLVRGQDYRDIYKYDTTHQLKIDDFIHGGLTFERLAIVQAQCVTTGIASDPDSIYLLQVTDSRGILYNPWFQRGTTSQYNVVAPAYPGTYYSGTLNVGVPWTWSTMIGDLWTQMPSLGVFPGLPAVPIGTPESWSFPGVSAWEALNAILDQQGFVVSVDLTQVATQYGIVVAGAADATFAAFQAANLGSLEEDAQWIDVGAGRVPGEIVVLFHRRNEYAGTEETVRSDGFQWATTPLYSVSVSAPATFDGATGVHYLWSDFSVRYDIDNVPLAADVVTAAAIAQDQAAAYYNLLQRSTSGYMRQVYAGARSLKTSGQVDGVRWFQTLLNERAGWRTECIRGYIWPECQFNLTGMGITHG